MACSLATTQTNACTSGIGKIEDPVVLLQLMAQLTADLLTAVAPATVTTVAAIQARGCTSGIQQVTNELTLLQIIAQNTCELTP
jgi:hypothetical protein